MRQIKDYKVGDKVKTQPFWNVKPGTIGEIVHIVNDYLVVKWPNGLTYKDESGYFTQIGGTCSIGNPMCIEKVEDKMPEQQIAGVRLSKANQEKLIEAARKAATDLGYCEQTDSVLEAMGFNLEPKLVTHTVVLSFKADLPVNQYDEVTDEAYQTLEQTTQDIFGQEVKPHDVEVWIH